jgi:hypothetical protein
MIRHKKRAAFGDTGDATQFQPSHWNANHLHPPTVLLQICPTQSVWDGPLGLSSPDEIGRGHMRGRADLMCVQRVRVTGYYDDFIDANDVYYAPEYSLDEGVTWARLGIDGVGPLLSPAGNFDAVRDSGWMDISPLARRDTLIRFVCGGTNNFDDMACLTLWGA